MAVYGPNANGQIAFTGYTNTLGAGDANVADTTGYVQKNGIGQFDDRFAKMLAQASGSSRVLRAVWRALTGASAGATATATKVQVAAVQGGASGIIPIETVNMVNRVTTAADRTAILAMMDRVVYPTSYPADLSGNGGGGKGSW